LDDAPLSLQPVGMTPYCGVHPTTALVCPRCNAAKGGRSKSKKKLAAARKNAKLGGRPTNKELARRKLARDRKPVDGKLAG
jgi:hypothetical protein